MAEKYNIQKTEKKYKEYWKRERVYKFDAKRKGKIYSIDTPPPYVSGAMHLGHSFSYAQQDFIVRFRRLIGNVFYPFGTDDNGLPTERFIEKINKIKSKSISRAEFIELCLKTIKKMTPGFIEDYKNLGISADYDIYYSTIDKNSQKVSQKSFIELFKKGFIYKKQFPTLWCSECQTAIAQAELEDRPGIGLFSTLRFKVDGKDLLIATTRPELLPACVGVFINPKDKKHKHLIGKKAKVPLFDFEVPILADESAEMEKGTGVLMVCSYGDKFDVEAINRHKLKPVLIINPNGTLNFGDYDGLKIEQAREKVLNDLRRKGLIKGQKKINHVVNVHDKCGCEIEFITTEQWFIKILNKKRKLIEQGKKVDWYPKFMFKRYKNWVKGLEWDWSISRERHFGVPIPVWECKKCNKIILPNEKELPIDPIQIKKKCPRCSGVAEPEKKVLDTWATSSLTPQIALSLIDNKIKIPFSLRPQAHDIIRTWAFYTIVKSLYQENKIPWNNVMISGYVTLGGEKMSKSKGTGIQTELILQEYGADALRFWAAGSKLGEDSDYQEKDLVTGKKFINKLFNASRFVFMNLRNYKKEKPNKLEKIDELFLKKLNSLVINCTQAFEKYEYSKAKAETEKFFWHDFCDNYLEIIKKRIYNEKGDRKLSAQYTLYKSLLAILKLIAPIMPFITEEIYQNHFKKTEKIKSIHLTRWPKSEKQAEAGEFELFLEVLKKIRQEKTKAKKPMNVKIILTLEKADIEVLKNVLQDLKDVTNAKDIETGKFDVKVI